MITTNQNPTMDTQKIKRKESKHNVKGTHQANREENKRRQEERRTTKTTRKQLTKWQ